MNKIHLFVYVYESEEHLPWSHNLKLDSNVYAALHMSVFFFFFKSRVPCFNAHILFFTLPSHSKGQASCSDIPSAFTKVFLFFSV